MKNILYHSQWKFLLFFLSFQKFLKSLSQLKNKSVKESMKNQNGALYKKKKIQKHFLTGQF